MSRPAGFFVFIALALSILGSIHFYFWARLVRDTALQAPYRAIATLLIVALGLSLPLALVGSRLLPSSLLDLLVWPAFVWMGLILLLLVSLIGTDLLRAMGALWTLASGEPLLRDPERRLFLQRVLGAAAMGVAGALGLVAVKTALGRVVLRTLDVRLARLPRALDGMIIVQLTDIHLGPTLGRPFIEELVARSNALAPDVVAITGDLVDGSVAQLGDAAAPLAGLRAKHGVFFVTGNHEYYSGADEWIAELARLGVRTLRNERVSLGEGAHQIDLAGVDDFSARGSGHGPNLPRALEGRDPSRELVLLAHQPRAIHEAAQLGVGLQLSGHTHGGQIWPFGYLVKLQQPYLVGLAREGDTQLYVSPGTGYWGPPMRLGTRGEITKIVLRSGPA